ncbi:carbohydrate-binding protein [Streptomyces paludis]|uniref:Carbohydrate-binding protein n=1 Tax=Streptomyces paludis TaxID=2282738 RepID=A0A345HRU7_9ACTN|nr:carbohydrate-binding protein [Streptomyces paludis]AXG79421.1 carbohydrate-binding protein [Streptomyces paludis]
MTAGNNGASKPEDDDPFGYLYEDGQAAAAAQRGQAGGYGYPGPAAQPGVPRTSYNQVRAVGDRRQAAPPPQQAPYGGQQAQYGQQQQAYAQAPTTAHPTIDPRQLPGQRGAGGGRGSGGGPNNRGLLIAAVAVVAVVVIGITVALMNGDDKKDGDAAPSGGASSSAGEPTSPSSAPSEDADDDDAASGELPKGDAAVMKLTSPAAMSTDIPGAKSESGAYITLNGAGAAASWTFDVPDSGKYTVFVTYGVPGKDADMTLSINGKAIDRPLNMKNFAHAPEGDWEKGWTNTYAWINLEKGSNTIKISCEDGNQCEAALDQFALKTDWVKG